MKKALIISLCALLLAGTGCKKNAEPEPQKVAVTGVAVIPRSVTLKVGETKEIIATITPANADNQNVSWSTSDNSVATVSNGLVTAVGAGEAIITATTADGGKTATCAVTVSAVVVPVTGIKIDQGATAEVEEGNTITLTATVQPENATDKTVTWSSSNDAIATVANGAVTGVTPGEVVITAKAGDKTATCTVTVKSSTPTINPTAEDLGKVIGADGKIYTNTQAAVSAGTKAAAVIVYVGSDTAEDGFTHGLAMSMRDCSNTSGYKWKTSDGTYDNPQQDSDLHTLLDLQESGNSLTTSDRDNDTWPAFKAALHNSITVTDGITADAPDGTSGWFLPSMFQWQQAIHAMTGKTEELSLYVANPDYVNDYFNAKITDSEAFLIKNCYASSSEFDATYNWHFDFNDGIARRNAKWCTYYVRAFLAF